MHWSGYDATALDIEVDPQRCRFGSRNSDFALQALVEHVLSNPGTYSGHDSQDRGGHQEVVEGGGTRSRYMEESGTAKAADEGKRRRFLIETKDTAVGRRRRRKPHRGLG